MRALYLASVTLHLVAAISWLGGMIFLAVVAIPAVRQVEAPAVRAQLLAGVGRRFRGFGWAAIGVLVVTGVVNGALRWGWPALIDPAFWASAPGQLLAAKLALVAGMLALSAVHDFSLGPRLTELSRAAPGSPAAALLRRRTVRLARLELGLGLAVVALAVALVRGV